VPSFERLRPDVDLIEMNVITTLSLLDALNQMQRPDIRSALFGNCEVIQIKGVPSIDRTTDDAGPTVIASSLVFAEKVWLTH